MKKCKNTLLIKSFSWNKESTELIDYENQEITKSSFEINSDANIFKYKDLIKFSVPNEKIKYDINEIKQLARIECDETKFYLKRTVDLPDNIELNSLVNKSESQWFVIKNMKSKNNTNGYKLIIGDVIKLGRVKLKISDIRIQNSIEDSIENHTHHPTKLNDRSNIENENNFIKFGIGVNNNLTENAQIFNDKANLSLKNNNKCKNLCRICYSDDKEVESPLIQPCLCSGTMKYIHLECLQKWLKSKVTIKTSSNENCMSYSLKQIECELCKAVLPDYIKYKNKMLDICDFNHKFKSYITFETFVSEKNTNRILYVVNLESKDNIRIGRSHDSDIRITDISVSRFHALIKKEKDCSFTISDNNSKFGTLVLVQSPMLQILNHMPLSIQIGRSFLSLSIKKSLTLFSCICTSKKIDYSNSYQTINSQFITFEKSNFIKIQKNESMKEESELIDKQEFENENIENQNYLNNGESSVLNKCDEKNHKDELQFNSFHDKNKAFLKVIPKVNDQKDIDDPIPDNIIMLDNSRISVNQNADNINNFEDKLRTHYLKRIETSADVIITNKKPNQYFHDIRDVLKIDSESLLKMNKQNVNTDMPKIRNENDNDVIIDTYPKKNNSFSKDQL